MDGTAQGRPLRGGALRPVAEALEMIKFSHTVFALPFALLAGFRAAGGRIATSALLWILLAMVGARTAAMSFNRIADRRIDARNPRTNTRALPAGRLSLGFAVLLCAAGGALFLLAAAEINPLTRDLALPVLAVLFGYSLTKRFTHLSHLVLGLCLGIAPAGAWIAVRGRLDPPAIWLSAAVLCWTGGFDILYALQDVEFDREHGLRSIPALFGIPGALVVSALLHAGALACFFVFFRAVSGGLLFGAGLLLAAGALIYQHVIVRPGDLSRVNAAFFTANGFVSLVLGILGIADLWVAR